MFQAILSVFQEVTTRLSSSEENLFRFVAPTESFKMRSQAFLWLLAVGIADGVQASEAAPPTEDQRPMRVTDKSRFRAACPDYGQYSKFVLQYVKHKRHGAT